MVKNWIEWCFMMGFNGVLMGFNMNYPLVNIQKAIEHGHL